MLLVRCTHCCRTFRIREEHAGRQARCPGCSQLFSAIPEIQLDDGPLFHQPREGWADVPGPSFGSWWDDPLPQSPLDEAEPPGWRTPKEKPAGKRGRHRAKPDPALADLYPTARQRRHRRPRAGGFWATLFSLPVVISASVVLYIVLTLLAANFLVMAYVCAAAGMVLVLMGVFWMAGSMLLEEQSVPLALACVFFPFTCIYVAIFYFDQTKVALVLILTGTLLFFSGWMVGGLAEQYEQYRRRKEAEGAVLAPGDALPSPCPYQAVYPPSTRSSMPVT